MKNMLFVALLCTLWTLPCLAKIRLVEWHTQQTLAPLIIPVRDTESPEQASQRYLKHLSQNPDLMELFLGRVPHLTTLEYRELDKNVQDSRVLLLANAAKDMTKNSERITSFQNNFKKHQQESFILPLNANLGLSLTETRELFHEVADKFPMMVAMGGEDVDPSLYKNKNYHSEFTLPERDRFEASLIKSYVTSARGFLLGVCRGSQLTAVALGYELIQDIPLQIENTNINHKDGWHPVETLKTTHSILKNAADGKDFVEVRSLHHQSVRFKLGGFLEVAARSIDGVLEATEFKNGLGLLLQFHPELMNNFLGAKILGHAVTTKNRMLKRSCSGVFQ